MIRHESEGSGAFAPGLLAFWTCGSHSARFPYIQLRNWGATEKTASHPLPQTARPTSARIASHPIDSPSPTDPRRPRESRAPQSVGRSASPR